MKSDKFFIRKAEIVLFLLSCLGILTVFNAWAYQPPIGIPDPGMWGTTHPIDSTAPSTAVLCPNWPSSESSGCYYIDNTHQLATDTGNTYGYPGKPRLTIPAKTYAAGSYIEVHGGPYVTSTAMTMNGTAENPIWFRGTQDSMPEIRAKLSIPNSKYAIFEYLDFNNITGKAFSISGMMASNICVRNSKFHDMTYPGSSTAVIGSTPDQGGSIHDLVFYNNLFHDIGNWQATTDEDFHAINPDLWGRTPPTTQFNVWSLSNTAYHLAGSLNQFNGDQRDAWRAVDEGRTETNLQNFHHMYSGKNLMYNSRQAMGAPKFTTDAIYSQNVAYDNYSISSDAGTGQGYQEGSRYVWLLFNKYYNLDFGVRQSNTNFPGVEAADLRSYMIGNVIYNIYQTHDKPYVRNNVYKPAQAITFEKGYYKRWIVDNTFFNIGGGVSIGGNTDVGDTRMSGNVIAGVNGIDDRSDLDFHISLLDATGATAIDYGFFQPRADNNKVMFIWAGLGTSIQESLSSFQSASGKCVNCWEGDPQFVDSANYDLRPREGSPLIGKGVRNEVYDIFEERYGRSIAYDFAGNPRPASGPWTLGAYEFVTGVPTSVDVTIVPSK